MTAVLSDEVGGLFVWWLGKRRFAVWDPPTLGPADGSVRLAQ